MFFLLVYIKIYVLVLVFVLGLILLFILVYIFFLVWIDLRLIWCVMNCVFIVVGIVLFVVYDSVFVLGLMVVGINNLFVYCWKNFKIGNYVNIGIVLLVVVFYLFEEWLLMGL